MFSSEAILADYLLPLFCKFIFTQVHLFMD